MHRQGLFRTDGSTAPARAVPGRTSIRTHLAIVAAVVVALGTAGVVYIWQATGSAARTAALSDSAYGAQQSVQSIDSSLPVLRTEVNKLAATLTPSVAQLLAAPSGCSLSFAGLGPFTSGRLDIIRADGAVLCSSATAPGPGYAGSSWLHSALLTPLTPTLETDPHTGTSLLVSTAPVAHQVIVVGALDVASAGPGLAQQFGGPRGLEYVVVGHSGATVLTESSNPGRWAGTPVAQTGFAAGAREGAWRDLGGTERLYAPASSRTTGWTVYAGADQAQVLASANAVFAVDAGLTGGGALLILGAIYLLYRRVARPLSAVSLAARRNAGRASFNEVPVIGPAEVAAVAQDFNALLAALGAEQRTAQESLERLRAADVHRRKLLHDLVSAQEDERRRIASDVHDDSIQVLTAATLHVGLIRRELGDTPVGEQMNEVERTLIRSVERLRHLVFQLHPPSLEQGGLVVALEEYTHQLAADTGISCILDDGGTQEPPLDVRAILFRAAQEALTNVRKHSRARSVTITLREVSAGFRLTVRDDGVGFDPEKSTKDVVGHLGLSSIRERAEAAGGWARFSSDGSGATVDVWVPASVGEVAA